MKFLILEIFNRKDLTNANPWCLYYKIKTKYNHMYNYSLLNGELILLAFFNLVIIRRQFVK